MQGLGLRRRMLMSYALKLEVSLLIHLGGKEEVKCYRVSQRE